MERITRSTAIRASTGASLGEVRAARVWMALGASMLAAACVSSAAPNDGRPAVPVLSTVNATGSPTGPRGATAELPPSSGSGATDVGAPGDRVVVVRLEAARSVGSALLVTVHPDGQPIEFARAPGSVFEVCDVDSDGGNERACAAAGTDGVVRRSTIDAHVTYAVRPAMAVDGPFEVQVRYGARDRHFQVVPPTGTVSVLVQFTASSTSIGAKLYSLPSYGPVAEGSVAVEVNFQRRAQNEERPCVFRAEIPCIAEVSVGDQVVVLSSSNPAVAPPAMMVVW